MTLSFRRKRRFRTAHLFLGLAALLGALTALVMLAGPARVVGWLTDGPGPDQPAIGPLVEYGLDMPSLRELEPRWVAPATCCTLLGLSRETGVDGCDWQVAEWGDSEPTRVPLSCPDGVVPTRDHPDVRLVANFHESGAEGCRWAAARWSDGVVTRVPAECPDGTVVRRWSLGAAECYGPPPVLDPDTAVAVVGRTTRNATPGSLFQRCRVVSYYGYPGVPVMGTLGDGEPDEVVVRLIEQTAAYGTAAPHRQARPGLHLLATVAQGDPQPDQSYRTRMPPAMMQRWVDLAEREDLVVFLDLQIGHSSPEVEMAPLLPLLRNPRVHLALDPEFAMSAGVPPGQAIGSMDASVINDVQARLRELVIAEDLPKKMLMVHQFQAGMITDKQALAAVNEVDLIIDVDGYGAADAKLAGYDLFAARENAEFSGIKLFYQQDIDLLEPEDVVRLRPAPDVVIYQ